MKGFHPMFGLKTPLLASLIALPCISGCVTGGSGGEPASIAGAVLVFSHLATSAQSGDQAAKKSWCEAFELVRTQAQPGPDGAAPSDADLTEKLIPEMHNLMRKGGYSMHRQQLAIVIKDALNVTKNAEASQAMKDSCSNG